MIKSYKHNNKTFYKIQLSCTDRYGKRHQPKFSKSLSGARISSKRMAEKLSLQYYNEYIAKLDGDFSQLQFKEWHNQFLESIKHTYKKSTIAKYNGDLRKWLSPSITEKKLSEIKKSDIHQFVFEELKSNGANSHTQKKVSKSLNRIFQSALEEGLIARNPVKGIKVKVPPPQQNVLNTAEAMKLLSEAKKIEHPFYYHWVLALFTGMRNGEIYALRWSNIDLKSKIITISSQYTSKDGYGSPKNNKSRTIPISQELNKILLELKNIGPFEEDLSSISDQQYLFNDLLLPRSSQWKHGEQSKIIGNFCEIINITKIKFHDLRATFITNMLARGVAVPVVMRIVGHARISTINVYLRLAGVEVKGSTDELGYKIPVKTDAKVLSFKCNNN